MINKQMKLLVDKMKNVKDPQDGSTEEIYKQELEVLKVSLENTIEYFKNASEEEILWLSCTWDDLSEYFKSNELVSLFIKLQTKYPNIADDIDADINYAKEAINYVG